MSYPFSSRIIRILLVGLDNAGKTTAAKGLVGGMFHTYVCLCNYLVMSNVTSVLGFEHCCPTGHVYKPYSHLCTYIGTYIK